MPDSAVTFARDYAWAGSSSSAASLVMLTICRLLTAERTEMQRISDASLEFCGEEMSYGGHVKMDVSKNRFFFFYVV